MRVITQNIRYSAIILIVLASLILPNAANARSLTEIKKSGVLRVAVDGMTPAFNFYQNGKLTGLEVDLAEAIASRMGLKIEWTVQPFNTLLLALEQDRFDLIAVSHTITPQRSKIVDFISPHYCTAAYIITKPGGPQTIADLESKTIAVAVGTVYYDKLATYKSLQKIMTVPSENDGYLALISGRADVWVSEKEIAHNAIKNTNAKLQYGDAILQQTNAMAVAKGNIELRQAIDKEFQALLADGSYRAMMRKYIADDICCK